MARITKVCPPPDCTHPKALELSILGHRRGRSFAYALLRKTPLSFITTLHNNQPKKDKMMTRNLKFLCALGMSAFTTLNAWCLTVNVAPNGNIQAAINSVAAAGGGTVNISSGSGTLSALLTVPSNVTITGAGTPATTLNLSSSIAGGIGAGPSAWSNIKVENMKIQGAGTTVEQYGIQLSGIGTNNNDGVFSNLQVLDTGYGAALTCCNNGSVTSCNFHNSGMTDLYHCLYFSGGSSTVISGCTLNDSPYGSGLHVNNWATIDGGESLNNTTSGNGQNGHSFTASTDDTFINYTINGCTADDNGFAYTTGGEYGFCLSAGSGTIENCTATGNRTANYLYGSFTSINNH
jgi:hypothetical protein